tara:strand:+ start:184 stop:843 length:660 start_codon:yes stop_codon:yes gene_type:complete
MHFCSAHFGGDVPWEHRISSNKIKTTCAYHTDKNTPSRSKAMLPRMKSKIPKMLEWRFVHADWYVWMDSSVKLFDVDIPQMILNAAGDNPLCLFRHSYVNTILEEGKRLLQAMNQHDSKYHQSRYQGEPIMNQIIHYYGDTEFEDNKLFAGTFFAYHRSAAHIMQEWFNENMIWTIQDQISLPYVIHKLNVGYSLLEGTVDDNPYFWWDWRSREKKLIV